MTLNKPAEPGWKIPILHRLSPELQWGLMALLALMVIAALLVYTYPKTVVTMGVQRSALDDKGEPKPGSPQEALRSSLKAAGILLEFVAQSDPKHEKPTLEWLVSDPRADITVANYTGAPLPPDVAGAFTSFGTVAQTPILFFARAGTPPLRTMRELKGRKLVFWSSPEGRDKAYGGETSGTSMYSSDRALQNLFGRVGLTPQTAKITNVWPQRVTLEQDWDVWISVGVPASVSVAHAMTDAILEGKVELIRFDDLEGVRRGLPELRRGTLAASAISSDKGVPRTDIPYLAFTRSLVARKNLDKGLEEPLAEAVLATYSAQTLLMEHRAFPNFTGSGWFTPNVAAEKYYRSGPNFWSAHVSPFVSSYLTNLLFILIPVVVIFWPLNKYGTELYKFYVLDLVTRRYSELESIEHQYKLATEKERDELRARAEEIHLYLQQTRLPLFHRFFVQQLFSARGTAESVKKRLQGSTPPEAK